MAPIRPENLARYPKDWKQISMAIKERAGWRCECFGECESRVHKGWVRLSRWDPTIADHRCPNVHAVKSEFSASIVILTTAHLNHTPEDCRPENLKAMCQSCHLNYDRSHHAETRALTLANRTVCVLLPNESEK